MLNTPKLVELSTNPSISVLLVFTPFGYKYNKLITLSVVSLLNSFDSSTETLLTTTFKPGSCALSSLANTSASSLTIEVTLSTLELSKDIITSASLGIALFLDPPFILTMLNSNSSFKALSILPKILLELPLSLIMSIPECPPLSPLMLIDIVALSALSCHSTLIAELVLTPPAQLTNNSPSSSLSRFINNFPSRLSLETAIAPDIPVSSSVVIKTSKAGCGIELSASKAIPYATAIPLSAPNVVSVAYI